MVLEQLVSSPFTDAIKSARPLKNFTASKFNQYDPKMGDAVAHLIHYQQMMSLHHADDSLMCKMFPSSLGTLGLLWFNKLPSKSVPDSLTKELDLTEGRRDLTRIKIAKFQQELERGYDQSPNLPFSKSTLDRTLFSNLLTPDLATRPPGCRNIYSKTSRLDLDGSRLRTALSQSRRSWSFGMSEEVTHEDLFDGGDGGGQREVRRRGGGEKRPVEEVDEDVKGEVMQANI
ncbi:hypothetical protein RHGRI_009286 [Rhododendron griersonianum]|uniref:Uncharacterized protein n=1 Tax=Rhododendron griersonianum TaxID=479676 RepID=A0AAV6L401_9ERIC|nr:hypothetical protein RHGRI_009286 [Rhododendron griersonianum]